MQKILVGLTVKNFTFSMLGSLNLNFSATFFWHKINCVTVFRADTGNNRKIVNFTFRCLYARPIKVVGLLKFWKLLSNSQITLNLENVNLLSKPHVKPHNGVACKKTCICAWFYIFDVNIKYKIHFSHEQVQWGWDVIFSAKYWNIWITPPLRVVQNVCLDTIFIG